MFLFARKQFSLHLRSFHGLKFQTKSLCVKIAKDSASPYTLSLCRYLSYFLSLDLIMIIALRTWFGKKISQTVTPSLICKLKEIFKSQSSYLLKGQIRNPFLVSALSCLILFILFKRKKTEVYALLWAKKCICRVGIIFLFIKASHFSEKVENYCYRKNGIFKWHLLC